MQFLLIDRRLLSFLISLKHYISKTVHFFNDQALFSNSDVTLELPFTLSHPKPPDETPPSTPAPQPPTEEAAGKTLGEGRVEVTVIFSQ